MLFARAGTEAGVEFWVCLWPFNYQSTEQNLTFGEAGAIETFFAGVKSPTKIICPSWSQSLEKILFIGAWANFKHILIGVSTKLECTLEPEPVRSGSNFDAASGPWY